MLQSAPPEVLIFFSAQYFTCCCLKWHERSLHATSLKTIYKQYCEGSGQSSPQGCCPTVASLEKWKKINESFSRCFDKSWTEQSLALCIKKWWCFIPQLAAFCCLQSPSAPVGRDQWREKRLGSGCFTGRRVGMRNSDENGKKWEKGFTRHASCVSGAVWRSLWGIPVPDHHSLHQDNKPNRLSLPYHMCQTCFCSKEDQGWGAPHQQDNSWIRQIEHPGTTLSVPFPGLCVLASTTS